MEVINQNNASLFTRSLKILIYKGYREAYLYCILKNVKKPFRNLKLKVLLDTQVLSK